MTCICQKTNPQLVEQAILNYAALPPSLYGWRMYRIEYGFECACPEGVIYLPPEVNPDHIESIINRS